MYWGCTDGGDYRKDHQKPKINYILIDEVEKREYYETDTRPKYKGLKWQKLRNEKKTKKLSCNVHKKLHSKKKVDWMEKMSKRMSKQCARS